MELRQDAYVGLGLQDARNEPLQPVHASDRGEDDIGLHFIVPQESDREVEVAVVGDDELQLVLAGKIREIGEQHPVGHP